jgi:hypothetical protein
VSSVIELVVTLAKSDPPSEVTHWTAAAMAKAVGSSISSVQRIWRAHGLQPHHVHLFKLSNDPAFTTKLRDIVGLYVDPPAHAIVLSIDEKSQIQALDRTQPGLPIKRGRCQTMPHDYKRHGTTTLFAALDVLEGKVIGRCMQAAPGSGIRPLSQYHRGRTPGRKAGSRHPRQLRDPQARKGPRLAQAPSSLCLPLHPDIRLLG